MSYDIVLSPKAVGELNRLDPPLAQAVENHLLTLGGSPTSFSRPAVLPYPPGSQLTEFSIVHDGRRHHFPILFHYGANEQALHVLGIGHIEYADPA